MITRENAREGVCCPKCECPEVRVVNTRHSKKMTIRYRRCMNTFCGLRFRTVELTPKKPSGVDADGGLL